MSEKAAKRLARRGLRVAVVTDDRGTWVRVWLPWSDLPYRITADDEVAAVLRELDQWEREEAA